MTKPNAPEGQKLRDLIAEVAADLSNENPFWTAKLLADALITRGIGIVDAQPVADAGGVTDADREAADAISVALLQCVPPDTDLTHFRLSVADLFARHRLQSVAAATANLQNRIDELTNEAEIFAADHVDQNRMVDRIAGLIGLPHDQELDTVAFELWISAQTAATAAKDAKIARLREALEKIQPVACGDWCRDGKHIPECENASAVISEAREARK